MKALKYRSTLRACYLGYITQAIVNNLAPILFIVFQEQYHLSFEMIGRLILLNFGTQIIADIVTTKYADRIGYRRSIVIAHLFAVVGLVSLGLLPLILPKPHHGLMIAVVIYAIGGGIIEVLLSPIVESLPTEGKASTMSFLHSFYSWGQMGVILITTTIIRISGTDIWYLLPVMWAILPLFNLYLFTKVPIVDPAQDRQPISLKNMLNASGFKVALLLMLAAGASELTMSQWASLFAELGLQVPKFMGDILGPMFFAVLMGIGRTIYGVWGEKINLQKALTASGVMCVICYAITIIAANPVISLLACALTGFSVSLMWPGTFSLSAAAFPKGGTLMFGLLAIFGDLGAAIGPWMAGVVSDFVSQAPKFINFGTNYGLTNEQTGLKFGILVGMIFPVLMVVGTLMFKRKSVDPREAQ